MPKRHLLIDTGLLPRPVMQEASMHFGAWNAQKAPADRHRHYAVQSIGSVCKS